MPSYKVLKQGFFAGKLYDPNGKRTMVHTDEPFPMKDKKEQVPSWLEAVEQETAAQKKKRVASEAKAAKAAKEKAKSDVQDIGEASFLGEGESSNVETL